MPQSNYVIKPLVGDLSANEASYAAIKDSVDWVAVKAQYDALDTVWKICADFSITPYDIFFARADGRLPITNLRKDIRPVLFWNSEVLVEKRHNFYDNGAIK